jgi:hypothetical protein
MMMSVVLLAPRFRPFLLLCVCAGVLAACGSGSHSKSKGTTDPTVPSVVVKTAKLKAGATDNETAGPLAGVDPATAAIVLRDAQRYLDAAVSAPLSTGNVGAGYGALFDSSVRSSASTVDEGALTDRAVGKVDGYTETATPVALSGLADTNGTLLYVATDFNVTVKAKTATGPLTINHVVELTFAPGGNKTWLISAYRVHTKRGVPAAAKKHAATTTESTVSKP